MPLKIKNNALGYEIDYTLEHFEYNTNSRILFFSGYPVFTNMNGSQRKMKNWIEKRNECYNGSILHFMRALYRNKITEENFTVQKVYKVLNKEKAKLKEEIRKSVLEHTLSTTSNMIVISSNINEPQNKSMSQPDSNFQIVSQILPVDSFAFAIDSLTAGMYFEKHLMISYKKTKPKNTTVYSFVKLLNNQPLNVFRNGSYYDTMNFFTENYWAETVKMARALPYDFVYEKKK